MSLAHHFHVFLLLLDGLDKLLVRPQQLHRQRLKAEVVCNIISVIVAVSEIKMVNIWTVSIIMLHVVPVFEYFTV